MSHDILYDYYLTLIQRQKHERAAPTSTRNWQSMSEQEQDTLIVELELKVGKITETPIRPWKVSTKPNMLEGAW